MAENKSDEVMVTKEAATLLKVSEKKIRYLVKTRQIPHQRVGRNTPRFSRSKLLEWLQDGTEDS